MKRESVGIHFGLHTMQSLYQKVELFGILDKIS